MTQSMETRASSINRALDQIGDKWSLLIIGDVLWGINTFSELLAATGMSRGVLADRLKWLEKVDCLQKKTTRWQSQAAHISHDSQVHRLIRYSPDGAELGAYDVYALP